MYYKEYFLIFVILNEKTRKRKIRYRLQVGLLIIKTLSVRIF